jgi:hypothetical protein
VRIGKNGVRPQLLGSDPIFSGPAFPVFRNFPSTLLGTAVRTRQAFGIGLFRQLAQIIYLRFFHRRLDPWEYYFFQAYLNRYKSEEKIRFAGWRQECKLDQAVNTGPDRDKANNKFLFYDILRAQEAPVPRTTAVYRTRGLKNSDIQQLHDARDAEHYLADPDHFPMFVKPVRGACGFGAFALHAPCPDRRKLELPTGEYVPVADVVARLATASPDGWLLQEMLQPHADLLPVCGRRLTSVRLIVILGDHGAEFVSAVWRVPTGNNVTDNFAVGRTGNIAAGVDLQTGEIQRAVQGAGWENRPCERHPDTGATLRGLKLPAWPYIRELCLRHATLFPDLRLQHWDVALTDRGPVILEVNVEGGLRTHQIVQQRGLYGRRLAALEKAV